jgi:hypothetical protein
MAFVQIAFIVEQFTTARMMNTANLAQSCKTLSAEPLQTISGLQDDASGCGNQWAPGSRTSPVQGHRRIGRGLIAARRKWREICTMTGMWWKRPGDKKRQKFI